jgi:hypothetical protein
MFAGLNSRNWERMGAGRNLSRSSRKSRLAHLWVCLGGGEMIKILTGGPHSVVTWWARKTCNHWIKLGWTVGVCLLPRPSMQPTGNLATARRRSSPGGGGGRRRKLGSAAAGRGSPRARAATPPGQAGTSPDDDADSCVPDVHAARVVIRWRKVWKGSW